MQSTTISKKKIKKTHAFEKPVTPVVREVNIGETIKGAINMYRATNGNQMPADIDALVAAELLGSDLGGTWALAGDNVTQADIDVDTCAIVNLMIHDEEVVYNCTDMPSGKPGCCDTTDSQV